MADYEEKAVKLANALSKAIDVYSDSKRNDLKAAIRLNGDCWKQDLLSMCRGIIEELT